MSLKRTSRREILAGLGAAGLSDGLVARVVVRPIAVDEVAVAGGDLPIPELSGDPAVHRYFLAMASG